MQYFILYFERNLIFSYLTIILTLFIMTITPTHSVAQDAEKTLPKSVIFETDMCSDVDDVGALAVLHALADKRGSRNPCYQFQRSASKRCQRHSCDKHMVQPR